MADPREREREQRRHALHSVCLEIRPAALPTNGSRRGRGTVRPPGTNVDAAPAAALPAPHITRGTMGSMGSTDRTSRNHPQPHHPHPTPIVSRRGGPKRTAQSPLVQVPLVQPPRPRPPCPESFCSFLRVPVRGTRAPPPINAASPRCPARPLQPVQHPDEYRSSSRRIPRVPDPRRDTPLPPTMPRTSVKPGSPSILRALSRTTPPLSFSWCAPQRLRFVDLPFLRSSGFPFFTVAITMSPMPAAGSLLRRPLMPTTETMYRFLPPVLSAQLMTAPTGRPRVILNLLPAAPPRPRLAMLN